MITLAYLPRLARNISRYVLEESRQLEWATDSRKSGVMEAANA
mgnify:CR=1 FL=1